MPRKPKPQPAASAAGIRDRIKELRRVRAAELAPHPANWRTHSADQAAALAAMIQTIGYADAALAYETPEGLRLIDGHLRASLDPDAEIPVLVLDVDDDEARQLLLTIDPLAAMAGADEAILAELLADVSLPIDAQPLLAELTKQLAETEEALAELDDEDDQPPPEVEIPETLQVVVGCPDETSQQALYEELTARGFPCKLLTT
ncbi:MAG TPA: hypothetical protein PKC18_20910 [Lacipirellulaceae bacterium]|nr:hypothetical protein [Lacipirellulaceae bacterium]